MTLEEILKDIERRIDLYKEESQKKERPDLRYRSEGLREALAVITASLDSKPETSTLTELAQKLRKIFDFRYLTVHKNWCRRPAIYMWSGEPIYTCPNDIGGWTRAHCVGSFEKDYTMMDLDLSEYEDENGSIDYSKCIVEVE